VKIAALMKKAVKQGTQAAGAQDEVARAFFNRLAIVASSVFDGTVLICLQPFQISRSMRFLFSPAVSYF
jgi:hypothetical protein